ncbi:MAG: hypothetical protein J7L99_07600 [Planctomycetes bacterium]|nr:hypothetical protein [Planctomycetota bacterium]
MINCWNKPDFMHQVKRRTTIPVAKAPHQQAGQVMVMLLLGIALLAGLVFYVVNVGDQINRRVVMQNAADSVAISGAAWMARSMNIIAMNNVAQTRLIALVPHLDALPLATKMAHEEVSAWHDCLEQQIRRGVPDQWLRDGLESLRQRMARQRDILAPIDEFLNNSGFDMATLTNWAIRGVPGPPPHGKLWQAAQALDEFSQATALSAGILSQANAVRYGHLDYAQTAFIVPLVPELPAKRTSFADFKKPVINGIIPDRQYPQRLGPYDRLFKWRNYHYRGIYERDRLVPGTPGHGRVRGGRGHVDIRGRRHGRSARGYYRSSEPHWTYRRVGTILLGYSVYGPFEWMMRRIRYYAWRELRDTYFSTYYSQIAGIKLGYIWGSKQLKQVHYPRWITDYPTARQLAQSGARVTRTMFYLVEIRSRYPKNSPQWLSRGSYVTNGRYPIAIWANGWVDPAEWNIPKIADYVWEDQYTYETTEDWSIGIRKKVDASGRPIWQTVYMVAQYVFGGIDVGGEVVVSDPANYTDISELPAPILLDTSYGDYDMSQPGHDFGVRRDIFTYLGIASRENTAAVWASRFGSGNPFNGVLAVSQSEIFNTTSWDLWTQDWKVKLVPVSRWNDWLVRLDEQADAGEMAGLIEPDEITRIQEYLHRFDSAMIAEMLHH